MKPARNKNKISRKKERMIHSLRKSGYPPTKIANELNISRGTVYYYLNPDKYLKKLDYVRDYERRQRELKIQGSSRWELEDG